MSLNTSIGDKVKVEKPKTRDPQVEFSFTTTDGSIRYVYGSLHILDLNASGTYSHMVLDNDSSGGTPIVGNAGSLTFEFKDDFWAANKDKDVPYYLLITGHTETEIGGKAYYGTFKPSQNSSGAPVASDATINDVCG